MTSVGSSTEALRHLLALHPDSGSGHVTLADRLDKAVLVRPCDLASSHVGARFVSLNRHGARRSGDDLVAINSALWVDLDVRPGDTFATAAPEALCALLLSRLKDGRVPAPSYVLFSGRGIWAVWLLSSPLPASATPAVRSLLRLFYGPPSNEAGEPLVSKRARENKLFRETEERMHAIWADFNLDRSVSDLQRLHRIAGTVNEKSGKTVRLLWPNSWSDVKRHDFDELREAIHPYTKAEVDRYRRERRRPITLGTRSLVTNAEVGVKARSYWSLIADDISRFIGILGPGGLEVRARRELAAFHLACSWANAGREGGLQDWCSALAPLVGLDRSELESTLTTLECRRQKARTGKVNLFNRRPVTPIYTYHVETIIAELGITAADATAAGLRRLVPGASREPLPARERSAAFRVRHGSTPRNAVRLRREKDGEFAKEKRRLGCTFAEIAVLLGRSATYVRRAIAGGDRGDSPDSKRKNLVAARPPRRSVDAGSRASGRIGHQTAKHAPAGPSMTRAPDEATRPAPSATERRGHVPVGPAGSQTLRTVRLLAYQIEAAWDVEYANAADAVESALWVTRAILRSEGETGAAAFPSLYSDTREVSLGTVQNRTAVLLERSSSRYALIRPAAFSVLIERSIFSIDQNNLLVNAEKLLTY